jgi:hypothetical protein
MTKMRKVDLNMSFPPCNKSCNMSAQAQERKRKQRECMRRKRKADGEAMMQGFVDNIDTYLLETMDKLEQPLTEEKKKQTWWFLNFCCEVKRDKCRVLGTQCGHGENCIWRNLKVFPFEQSLPPDLILVTMGIPVAKVVELQKQQPTDVLSAMGMYDPAQFPPPRNLVSGKPQQLLTAA